MMLCLICFAKWFAQNRQEGIFRITVILFLPVLGFVLFFVLWLKGRYGTGTDNKACLYDGDTEKAKASGAKRGFDVERALNLVPMEEALLLNDNIIKRKLLLDILKDDMVKYPGLLRMALDSDDTETSHYAAAGIVEVKRKLLQSVQELSRRYESQKDMDSLVMYAYAMKNYLGCGLLDESSGRKAMEKYQELLKGLLEFYSGEEVFYIDRINYEIDTGEFEAASLYCESFMKAFKQAEMPYFMYLKLFYNLGDRKSFRGVLETLKDSSISLSCNTWNTIKFWTEVFP